LPALCTTCAMMAMAMLLPAAVVATTTPGSGVVRMWASALSDKVCW